MTPIVAIADRCAFPKHAVHAQIVAALREIRGENAGFWNDLTDRIYSRLITPDDGAEAPFVCVPLIDLNGTYASVEGAWRRSWTVTIYGFVDDPIDPDSNDTEANEAVAKLEDDIAKALMPLIDTRMNKTVLDAEIVASAVMAGVGEELAGFGQVQIPIRFEQLIAPADLGPVA